MKALKSLHLFQCTHLFSKFCTSFSHLAFSLCLAFSLNAGMAFADSKTDAKKAAPNQTSGDVKQLKMQVDILTEELQKLKSKLVLPETKKQIGVFGLGPAASKVYLLEKGLSVGGYAEFYIERKIKDYDKEKDLSIGDVYRYVQYIGFKFTDWLVANAELEFEHVGTASNWQGKGGSIGVEFVYLDFLLHEKANARFGLILVPMGFINQLHEPPFYHGNIRPRVERILIPSTWSEMGGGFFGKLLPGFEYKLFLLSGFNASKFSHKGWRSGRQKGTRFISEDWGAILRLDYKHKDLLWVGGTFYYGQADQNQEKFKLDNKHLDVHTMMLEAHVQMRFQGLALRGLFVYSMLPDAKALTPILLTDSNSGKLLASDMMGWYAEISYDVGRWIPLNMQIQPFVRIEMIDTQFKTPTIAGRKADDSLREWLLDVGVSYKPHPQVVLKVNYRELWSASDKQKTDSLYFGAGFIY